MKLSAKIILTLSILVALVVLTMSAFFYPMSVTASTQYPWDIDVTLQYGSNSWHYRLADNVDSLTNIQINSQGVYCAYKGKKGIVDNLIKQGFDGQQAYNYVLPNFVKLVENIEKKINCNSIDATVKFDANAQNKFSFTPSKQGVAVNRLKLMQAVLDCCGKGNSTVNIPVKKLSVVTTEQLQANCQLLATFSTTFNESVVNRVSNIRLATKSINGTVLKPNEQFSFNQVVGPRTTARGYKNAKVIIDGNYKDGVGGGVCQVSTTLYNTALLSGLDVTKVTSHSLLPSYVKTGFDAMVSYDWSDLVFCNNTGYTVYICGYVSGNKLTFTMYGKPEQGVKRVRQSVELERQHFGTKIITDSTKYPDLVYNDQTRVLVNGKDRIKCAQYLLIYKNDKLIEKKFLRKVTYQMVEQVVAKGSQERPQNALPQQQDTLLYEQ